jgi:hypothetical protein
VTQLHRVTAWCRMRRGSRLQAASWRAALCWPAQWCSGGGAGATVVAEGTEPWRGCMRDGGRPVRGAVAMARGLRVLCKRRD